jgi:nickel/cobalt exporter
VHTTRTSGSTALLIRDPARTSTQAVEAPRKQVSRRGLLGMGVAGGLVPSPSALVVLLSAIALGRTVFGVILVIAYGAGMAGTLTLAGVLLVRLRDRYARRTRRGRGWALVRRWGRLAPYATASLVFIVGLGLAIRSLALV